MFKDTDIYVIQNKYLLNDKQMIAISALLLLNIPIY